MDTQTVELPVKIEGIIFKRHDNKFKFLVLKRSSEDGGYFQPLTGGVYSNESLNEALLRELKEETGIEEIIRVIPNVWHFHWEYKNDVYLEFVFGVEVISDAKVNLSDEHETYSWEDANKAMDMFKHENNKKALQMTFDQISKNI